MVMKQQLTNLIMRRKKKK